MKMKRFPIFLAFTLISFINAVEQGDNALVWVDVEKDEKDESTTDQIVPTLSDELFRPTSEWQEIKPDQTVPRGLHVRLNLETGKREAKIIDDDKNEKKFKYWSDGDRKGIVNSDHNFFTANELKHALKQFEKEAEQEIDKEPAATDFDPSNFRSYEELKKDFEQMNMQIKSDSEIITDLLNEYVRPNSTPERKLSILTDLEYLVHQIDNARTFVDLGGMKIVRETLNSSEAEFREAGAFLIGSASQSNPKVQIAALDNGVLHHIIRLFSSETNPAVRKKLLFAVSSMLRHFPFAQKKFLDLGGIEIFEQVFRRSKEEKEKFKVITLIFDLLQERNEIESQANSRSEATVEKLRQYRDVALMKYLKINGFCPEFGDLLLKASNFDEQERVLRTMDVTAENCRDSYREVEKDISVLNSHYRSSLTDDADNDYIQSLLDLTNHLLLKINLKDEL